MLCAGANIQSSRAAPVTASFDVSATIVAGCEVDGGVVSGSHNAGSLGQLEFGSHSSLFTGQVTTSLVQSTSLKFACTPNTNLNMHVDGGEHVAGGRHMKHASGPMTILYRLYSNAALTNEIQVNSPVSISVSNDNIINIPIYGKVLLNGNDYPGTYQDSVTVTLSW